MAYRNATTFDDAREIAPPAFMQFVGCAELPVDDALVLDLQRELAMIGPFRAREAVLCG